MNELNINKKENNTERAVQGLKDACDDLNALTQFMNNPNSEALLDVIGSLNGILKNLTDTKGYWATPLVIGPGGFCRTATDFIQEDLGILLNDIDNIYEYFAAEERRLLIKAYKSGVDTITSNACEGYKDVGIKYQRYFPVGFLGECFSED